MTRTWGDGQGHRVPLPFRIKHEWGYVSGESQKDTIMAQTCPDDVAKPAAAGRSGATRERRGQERHHAVRFTAKLTDHSGEMLCLLRDISAEGMKANIYSDLHVDEEALVEFPNGQRIASKLVWAREGEAGFRFVQPIDLERLLHPTKEDPPRRSPRIHFETVARLVCAMESKLVRVLDISLGGAKLETGPVGLSGDHVTVQFDGLPTKGAWIRWTDGRRIGVQFDCPMSFDELCTWLNARRSRRPDANRDETASAA
ncbi:PilZ domain-containing protein [Sphingorhabdus soli]|uniref:PilZ domain-containing protein n=2 Tax=Flavisphingopyxis soli TaxID=2601267 RepID=A0A5C6ULB3_9SPHN|nr:PilZ domain-containing protein [Sphingorhabdus soli]